MNQETQTQLVPYDVDMAIINDLQARYMDVIIPEGDKEAYAMVIGGIRECRELRLKCDAWHKERKADILKAATHYDKEKNRVHELLGPIESHLKKVRQAEDDRIEAQKQEKIRKEQERVEAIKVMIEYIKTYPLRNTNNRDTGLIQALIEQLKAITIEADIFEEFTEEAIREKEVALALLQVAFDERRSYGKQQAEAKAEAKRLERVRKEQEAEAARLKAEQDKIDAEKAAFEAEKKAEQERKDREAFEIKAREEAKAKAEREAREAEERKAKEEADRARKEALKPDQEKIGDFYVYLKGISPPSVTSVETMALVHGAMQGINDVANTLFDAMEALCRK